MPPGDDHDIADAGREQLIDDAHDERTAVGGLEYRLGPPHPDGVTSGEHDRRKHRCGHFYACTANGCRERGSLDFLDGPFLHFPSFPTARRWFAPCRLLACVRDTAVKEVPEIISGVLTIGG